MDTRKKAPNLTYSVVKVPTITVVLIIA